MITGKGRKVEEGIKSGASAHSNYASIKLNLARLGIRPLQLASPRDVPVLPRIRNDNTIRLGLATHPSVAHSILIILLDAVMVLIHLPLGRPC